MVITACGGGTSESLEDLSQWASGVGDAAVPPAPQADSGWEAIPDFVVAPPIDPLNPADAPVAPAPAFGFFAFLSIAPGQDAALVDVVTLEVRGTGLRNVELLPPEGYAPVIARFNVINDSVAVLRLDTRTMLNGVLAARIVAFNAPPGEGGAAVEVMPTRQWRLVNDPQPRLSGLLPPRSYRPLVIIQPDELAYVDPEPLRELYALSDAALMARLNSDGAAIRALMDRYQTEQIWLEPTGIDGSGQGEWFYCRRNLTLLACQGGFAVMIARMEALRP